eukprot:753177-Hanusia_phi.AAC.1
MRSFRGLFWLVWFCLEIRGFYDLQCSYKGDFPRIHRQTQDFQKFLRLQLRGKGEEESMAGLVHHAVQMESDAWDGMVHKHELEELIEKTAYFMDHSDHASSNSRVEMFSQIFNILIALAHKGIVNFSETEGIAESIIELQRMHADNINNTQLSYCALLSSIAHMARTTNSTEADQIDFMKDAIGLISEIRAKGMTVGFQVYAILESLVLIICMRQGSEVRAKARDRFEAVRREQVLDPVISDVLLWVLQGTCTDENRQSMSALSQNEYAQHYVMRCVLHAILAGRSCSMSHVIAAWRVIDHWGFSDSKLILETMFAATLKLEQIGEALPVDVKMVLDMLRKNSFTEREIERIRMESLALVINADTSHDPNVENEEIMFPLVTEETQSGREDVNYADVGSMLEEEKRALEERLAMMSEEEVEGPELPPTGDCGLQEAAGNEVTEASLESEGAGNQTKDTELNISWEEWERIAESASVTVSEVVKRAVRELQRVDEKSSQEESSAERSSEEKRSSRARWGRGRLTQACERAKAARVYVRGV